MSRYDVVIVGAGPAGLFCAWELTKELDAEVLVVERGRPIGGRHCPAREEKVPCRRCNPCHILSGFGGAGTFSDGKLMLSPEVGGTLSNSIPRKDLEALVDYVDQAFLHFGAPKGRLFGTDEEKVAEFKRRATLCGLRLIPSKVRHLGTENAVKVLSAMGEEVGRRAEVRTGVAAEEILVEGGRVAGVRLSDGTEAKARFVVVAPGREGANWLRSQAERLGLTLESNPIDVGVRVEVPAAIMEELTNALYEPKLVYFSRSFDDKIRTFCVCPNGEVVYEYSHGVVIVNGHSYAGARTENTNFAILVSTKFTEPFKEPIEFGVSLAKLANLLSGGVIVQRLGDLKAGRRSTEGRIEQGLVRPTLPGATPGDISFALPYRHLSGILEMLEALDQLAP
ncbi:MAG TPA: FAD-dependent oxidoreductase, partial [Armatimonadetes bacterium]|nr:FAD-dependent oxidoreductase [Armatimonadota bacterium]